MNKQLGIAIVLALLAAGSVALFWHEPTILFGLLCIICFAFILNSQHPNAFWIFVFAGIFGPLTEIICIKAGAWSYTTPSFLGIPLWLPLLWGGAGLLIATFADHFRTWEKK